MTLEEAKKILEKEGFNLGGPGKPGKPGVVSEDFTEYESPEICEAMQIVCSAGFQLAMLAGVFDERKERLKKEYEKNTKAPVSGKEQPKEKKGIIYPTTFPKADFYYKHVLDEGNPALKESASQFNDALLDEQAKKIAELTKEKSNLEDQITVLNACKKHNDKIDRKQIKSLGKEIARLNGIIHDKNAILSDVAEELRLTKIREKNLAELGLKYVGENEKLKKELADKVVDKIDAQALKSAESALAWKEKVIAMKDMALAYDEKKIADLGKELKAQKDLVDDISLKYDGAKHNLKLRIEECEKLKKELYEANKRQQQAYRSCADKNKEIRALKLQISALEKRGNGIDWKRNADAIKLYVNRASRERLWNPINQEICNEQELSFIINHGGKRVKYALRFDGADIIYECSDPDKKPRIPTPEEPKHGNSREDFIKKTIDNYNRRAANLGCVGSKDGNGIFDQMVGVDIAEECADLSGIIVICGKDFVKKFKEKEESLSEFFKNIEDEAVESMSIESGHLGCNELEATKKELAATKNELEEKTKLVEELTKEKELLEDKITIFNIFKKRNDKAYQRQIRSFDKEISDLGNELEATKKELEAFKESYKRRIKEDSEHFEHIQKICNAGLQKWLIESEYLEKDKPFRFTQLPDFSEEEQKKVSSAKNDNSHGDITNQKDISTSFKVTVRLLVDDVRDLFKKIKRL